MALTPVQRQTLVEALGSRTPRPVFSEGLAEELRADLERRVRSAVDRLPADRSLWVSKGRLVNLHARCEGLYLADELGETVFSYGRHLAVGRVVHKAVEIGVYAPTLGESELAERAMEFVRARDDRFDDYARLLHQVERSEVIGEAVRQLAWFRAAFPPLERSWNPVVEWPMTVGLLGERVVLSARPDLVLGTTDPDEPMRARRLVVELKGGRERPEQVEDVRFYALVLTLAHGVPPFRVMTVNLQEGRWRVQDVTEDLLRGAVRRVADGCLRAAALLGGVDPQLRPGPWCSWCARAETCPVSSARAHGG